MYKIPEKVVFHELLGVAVTGISFSINTIMIYLEKIGSITIYGSFSLSFDDKTYQYEEIYPVSTDLNLLKLLEKKIIDVKINDCQDVLTLSFDEDIVLNLMSNKCYESFEIVIGAKSLMI